MKRIRTSRWLSTMLRKMERFQRVAAWPDSPGMRFVLRHSPVHWMRERLWLLARLEPQVHVVNRNLTNTFHLSYAAPGPMATRIVHRNFTILRHLHEAESQGLLSRAPSMRYEREGISRAPDSQARFSPTSSLMPVQQSLPRREMSPRPWFEGPLAARLGQRARRVDDVAADLPARLVRAPSAAPPSVVAPGFTGPNSSPVITSLPRANGASPWPAPPAPAAPVNVQQLTNEVLRQLDRRLIASRERMGRI